MITEAGDAFARVAAALAGHYRVEREIGRGGMATVYLAHELEHDREVAIKVLRPEHTATIAAHRFLHEIRLTARLDHPRVVPLHDSGEAGGMLYYVMPYVQGESLRMRLARERQLAIPEALRIGQEVAEGLAEAHASGIIHRDIKPENILLSEGHALVADFGIARAAAEAGSTALTSSGTFVGTPLYASPEQLGGEQQLDGRTDLYSLACVVYEMLAGEPPFTGPTPQAILAKHALEPRPSIRVLRDTVPPGVDDALRRGMARVPADRFANVAEFGAALARHAADQPTPGAAPARSRRWRALGYAGALAVLAIVLVRALPSLIGPVVNRVNANYHGSPSWSVWDNVAGEFFSVVAAADSVLVVQSIGSDSLYARDARAWSAFAVPESLTLQPFDGLLPGRRLLAVRTEPDRAVGNRYSWLELTPRGLEERERLPALPAERLRGSGWTDGRETVVWTDGLDRLEAGRWVSESTRTTGFIRNLWGTDFHHRQAIASSPADSLLEYDGVGWRAVDILPERSSRVPSYAFGTLLGDGAAVVLGEGCDTLACVPVILQQDRFGGDWRELHVTAGLGIPLQQAVPAEGACGNAYFTLTAAAGSSAGDYYVWGRWTRCERLPRRRVFHGCPPEWPCTWHVSDGRIVPVPAFRGVVMRAVQPTAGGLLALVEDGMIWQRTGGTWRTVDQVPGLLERKLAASGTLLVRSVGTRINYEPGAGDTVSTRVQFQLAPSTAHNFEDIRALVASDSAVAVLGADGSVFRSACALADILPGGPKRATRCGVPVPLAGPGPILAIALLRDGTVLGVGPGQAVHLAAGRVTRESLPAPALRDTLWAFGVAADGTATVIGRGLLLEREPGGQWTVLRSFPAAMRAEGPFALLPGGDVAVGSTVLAVWQRTGDAPPRVLRRAAFGEAEVGALHALPDGRLVAGFAPGRSTGLRGMLQVWADPARDSRSERVSLPLNIAITALAADGYSLFAAGPGGTMALPLAALPFAAGAARLQ